MYYRTKQRFIKGLWNALDGYVKDDVPNVCNIRNQEAHHAGATKLLDRGTPHRVLGLSPQSPRPPDESGRANNNKNDKVVGEI